MGNSMVAKPEVSITADEPHADVHGQSWSPAKVTLTWPEAGHLPGPSIQISLVAAVRGEMTVTQLRAAHMQAAHDVLSAAILSIEAPPTVQRAKRRSIPS
jgi:hypothetical protein